MPATDENLEFGHRARSRPPGQQLHQARGPRLGNDRGAQRVRDRREQPANASCSQRMMAAAYEWHNYGKIDHRQPQRHRARADRQPAGLLQEVLPARQRRADRRRQVRRGQGPRADVRSISARIPKPKRKLDDTYTEEPAQDGERLVSCAASARSGSVGRRLPHPVGRPRGLRRR